MRNSFIFYRSFYEAIDELNNEQKGIVYSAIFDYSLNEKEPKLEGVCKAIFTLIKPQIDANNQKYNNGKKGGRPVENKPNNNLNKTKNKPNNNLTITETKPNVNDNVNVNVNDNDNEKVNVNVNENDLLKKETKFDFLKYFIDLGIEENLIKDWIMLRKQKKGTFTKTACEQFLKNVEDCQLHIDDAIKICIDRNWITIKKEWIKEKKYEQFRKPTEDELRIEAIESGKKRINELFGVEVHSDDN